MSLVTPAQPVASQQPLQQPPSAHYGLFDARPAANGHPTPPRTSSADPSPGVHSPAKELKLHVMSESVCQDLKLMHHYARSIYQTLGDGPVNEHIWVDSVPREAFRHVFLMHGLLALSALHLSLTTFTDKRENMDLAIRHYTAALNLYTSALNNVNEQNCHALFAFSSVAAIIAFAMSQVSSHADGTLMQDTLEIFRMLRGINVVVQVSLEWIENGPLGGLLRPKRAKNILELGDDVEFALKALEVKCRAVSENEADMDTYVGAIQELRESFHKAALNPQDRAPAVSWPILVPKAYMDALTNRQPPAFLILAHYAVLLHDLRGCWWAGDTGVKILEAVSEHLETTYAETLEWPRKKLGLTGTSMEQDTR